MRLILCADAVPHIGAGHVMRSIALAQAALAYGYEVSLLGRIHIQWLRERLVEEEIPFLEINDHIPEQENPHELLNKLKYLAHAEQDDWIALDGYHFTQNCQKAIRQGGYRLMLTDDYAHLPEYSCDILHNQNPVAPKLNYAGDIEHKLLGLNYALLRKEFASARENQHFAKNLASPNNILLSLGGGNYPGFLEAIVQELNIPEMGSRTLRIIGAGMDEARIAKAFAKLPCRLEILSRMTNMAALFLKTDLCITAGGSTCWELACLGIPFLTVALAENQYGLCQWLAENKLAPRFSQKTFRDFLNGGAEDKPQALMKLVDSKGALRIVSAMNSFAR